MLSFKLVSSQVVVLKIQSPSQDIEDNNQNSGLTPDAGHFGRPIVQQMPQHTVSPKRKKKITTETPTFGDRP